MLKFNIRGENVEVTESIRDYVVKRISKLQKFFEDSVEATAHVNLKVYPNRTYKVEGAPKKVPAFSFLYSYFFII